MPELNAPFGSWTTDIELKFLEPGVMQALMLGVTRTVKSLNTDDGAYALKYWYEPVPQEDVFRQMQICIQAEDCAVPIVGRVFDDGAMVGYVMPLETPLDPASIATKDERLAIIHELCNLVEHLHQKGIVHGDLKCQNLVRCANGSLRFIDFDCASRVGDGYVATQATAEFISQRRMLRHGFNPEPLTLAEDYHALALTIFELYTGQDNFYRFGPPSTEDYEEWSSVCCDAIVVGMPPDVTRIDDADIAQLIMSYFNRGPPRILTSSRSVTICAQHELPYRCLPGQRHTYTRLVRCHMCERHGHPVCPNLFVAPPAAEAGEGSPTCRRCLPYVTHIDLE